MERLPKAVCLGVFFLGTETGIHKPLEEVLSVLSVWTSLVLGEKWAKTNKNTGPDVLHLAFELI